MKADSLRQTKPQYLKSKIADYARLVRFSHTVFALPFALSSIALAWPRHPVTLRGFLVDLDRHGERAQRGDGI